MRLTKKNIPIAVGVVRTESSHKSVGRGGGHGLCAQDLSSHNYRMHNFLIINLTNEEWKWDKIVNLLSWTG